MNVNCNIRNNINVFVNKFKYCYLIHEMYVKRIKFHLSSGKGIYFHACVPLTCNDEN